MSVFFSKITALFMVFIMTVASWLGIDVNGKYKAEAPNVGSVISQEETKLVNDATFYVSPNGSDENDGSFSSPFASLERAKQAVRETNKNGRTGITVAVMAGNYSIRNIDFTAEDSGTQDCPVTYCAYGDGEVIINGGATLKSEKFKSVTDASVLARLSDDAKKNVVCYDLKADGITEEQYGKIYAIGSYNTAEKYTGDYVGPIYSELFVNDSRMTIARYPNEGFLETTEVISTGDGYESDGSLTVNPNWGTSVNPKSDVYGIDSDLAERINSWKTLDDVWMFGFWKYDWADASTPIGSFDYENKTLSPKFVSLYGTKVGAPYYFFNIFEELDSPNEWYLDRENGLLYLYPQGDISSAAIDISLSTDTVITGENLDNFVLDGFTVKGTRGDGINISGNNVTIRNCLVKNVSGDAVILSGYNNLVTKCEITHTGKGGIYISGGDRETLTAGNSKADNNFIHDWSEIYQTYQPAMSISGVGNCCSHNEIYNSPHEAITYSGNNHIIEYNEIHDVCLLSDDAAAIYSGRHWDWYGNVIRYNCIYNLGSGDHHPNGIYFDDALSGQTAYGNILINIPGLAFLIGGGRDITVTGNIIVNSGDRAVLYDQRAIDGVTGGWFTHSADINSDMWQWLFESPWQTGTWKTAYPQMTKFSSDFDNTDNPNFIPNPAGSVVSGNLVLDFSQSTLDFEEKVKEYSDVSGNAVYMMTKADRIFTDYLNGDYSLKDNSLAHKNLPDFEEIPLDKIGRY